MTQAGPQVSLSSDGLRISMSGAFLMTAGVTLGFGLGYAKARFDSDEIIQRLASMKVTLDDLGRYAKYGNFIESTYEVVDGSAETESETSEGESSGKR